MVDGGYGVRAFQALVKAGDTAYRDAIALQLEGDDAADAWDAWEENTAALLLISWTAGAKASLTAAGVPKDALTEPTITKFAKVDERLVRFNSKPIREAVQRFMDLVPMTRGRWETLLTAAFDAAGELRQTEQTEALQRILDRSPALTAAVRGGLQTAVDSVNTPAARAVTQGAFFVTGMSQEQVVATKKLLAKVIRQEKTVSVAGKELERLGVGDFVEQATLETGADLTAARLETVYRTNLNRAQTQGRLDIVRDPVVRKFVPLMKYNATRDARTRPTHKAMDGFVATVEQIDGQGIACPLGFNCRCSWSPVPLSVAAAKGWCDDDGVPDYEAIRKHNGNRQQLIDKGLVPDSGFIAG